MTQENAYELVLKAIAALELNDKAPHIQKLQLCNALARGVLELKPGEEPRGAFLGTRAPMFCFIHAPKRVCRPQFSPAKRRNSATSLSTALPFSSL